MDDVVTWLKAKSECCILAQNVSVFLTHPLSSLTVLPEAPFPLWPHLLLLCPSLPLLHQAGLLTDPWTSQVHPLLRVFAPAALLAWNASLWNLCGSIHSPPSSLCSNNTFPMKLTLYLIRPPALAPTAQHFWFLWFCSLLSFSTALSTRPHAYNFT